MTPHVKCKEEKMKPGGIILTKMIWNKPKYYPFNIGLLAWQLLFLTAGKIYGKIDVQWRQVWRAATICHVRLCLGDWYDDLPTHVFKYISFTAPEVKIEEWRYYNIPLMPSRFSYLDPTFSVSDAEVEAMNAYAEKIKGNPVARKYDYLQLLSYVVNLPLWIIWPRCWGREVIGWFNLPGGREVCSSGVTAVLKRSIWWKPDMSWDIGWLYDTSMISPCLFDIDKNWKRKRN